MPKELDANHLALMQAVHDAVIGLRKVNLDISTAQDAEGDPQTLDFFLKRAYSETTAVVDRLRLTLKGRVEFQAADSGIEYERILEIIEDANTLGVDSNLLGEIARRIRQRQEAARPR